MTNLSDQFEVTYTIQIQHYDHLIVIRVEQLQWTRVLTRAVSTRRLVKTGVFLFGWLGFFFRESYIRLVESTYGEFLGNVGRKGM